MSEKVKELMEEDKLEQQIKDAYICLENGLVEEQDFDSLPENYQVIETQVKTKGYTVYYVDGKVKFATALNVENGYGYKVSTPELLTEEELNYIKQRSKKAVSSKKVFYLISLIFSIICAVVAYLNCLIFMIESIVEKTEFDTFITNFGLFFFVPVVCASIYFVISYHYFEKNRK